LNFSNISSHLEHIYFVDHLVQHCFMYLLLETAMVRSITHSDICYALC